ncbi:MAG TPA: hypothetical protein VMI75_31780 [Polyangiaceae bacterium]|nr:hypothetical protein [Polyangiaceae bacterium]
MRDPRSALAHEARVALAALALAPAVACGGTPRPEVPPVSALPFAPAVTRAPEKPKPPPTVPIVVERKVSAKMRDGTELFADVY